MGKREWPAALAAILLMACSAVAQAPSAAELNLLIEEQRWTEAEAKFALLEKEHGLTPKQLDQAVDVSTRLNHWERVTELLENYRRRLKLSVPQRIALYEAYLKQGQAESAEKELRTLVAEQPDDERIIHLLAFLYLSQNRFQTAIDVYQQFLERSPNSIESRINLALVFFKQEQGEAGLAQLKTAFEKDATRANTYFYRQLVRNMPPDGLLELARDVKQAIGQPQDGNQGHLLLAREFENLNRYDPAITHYQSYLSKQPANSEVRYALAKLYYHVGRDAESEEILQPLLEAKTPQADQARLLAAELAVRSNRFQRARELLDSLPDSYRQLPLFQFFWGRVAEADGDLATAEKSLQSALKGDPNLVQAYFHLGQIYLRTGRAEEGRRLLKEYQKRKR